MFLSVVGIKKALYLQKQAQEKASRLDKEARDVKHLILDLNKGYVFHLQRLDTPDELQHHEGTQLGAGFAIMLRKLEKLGFSRPKNVSGEDWMQMLNQVYPYLEEYGIEAGRCVMHQMIEDHKNGRVRKVSDYFRLS